MDPEKRKRILDAASELFAHFGFKKTSIDEIAQKAGIGKGTVYLVSKSKADLFYQVVHRELTAWLSEAAELIDPRVPADQLLVTCSVAAYGYLQSRPIVRELMLGNYDQLMPLWTDHLTGLRSMGATNTRRILEIGIDQGIFREDLDVVGCGKLLQEMQAAGLMVAYRENQTPEQMLKQAHLGLDLLLNGLRTR